jgi:hypothetical protein
VVGENHICSNRWEGGRRSNAAEMDDAAGERASRDVSFLGCKTI